MYKAENINFNDVILKEDNVPPVALPLDKITDTHPGKNGIVYVVTVKIAKGFFKRLIVKLCLLSLHIE